MAVVGNRRVNALRRRRARRGPSYGRMLADDKVQDPSRHVIAAAPSCREGIGYGVRYGVSVTDVGQDAFALRAGMGTIDEMLVSKTSPMPAGLFNRMTREEILDLVAYLISGADPNHDYFKK